MPPRTKKISLVLLLVILAGLFAFGGIASASQNEQRAQFAAPILVANTSFLNIRTGPGAQFSVLITVVGGTELPVLGLAKDMVWYQVSTVAGIGWVNVQYTLARGDFSKVPFVEAPQAPDQLVIQDVSQLGQGGGGTVATTTGQVTTTSRVARPWGVSILGGDLRTGPSDSSGKLLIAMGEDRSRIFPLVNSQFSEGRLWYQFTIPDIATGWNEAHQLFLRPMICPGVQQSAVIMTTTATLGSGPDATPVANATINAGQEAYALDVRQGLVKIELVDGTAGWVPVDSTMGRDERGLTAACTGVTLTTTTTTTTTTGQPLPTPQPSLSTPRVIINTAFLNVRTGPGGQYTVVATVPGGTELPVIGITGDSVWYLVQGTFGQGWVNMEFVIFRGVADNVPIIKNAYGVLATPEATVSISVTLYAAPNTTFGTVGTLNGPTVVPVVARTSDFAWVQLNTSLGFGWVPASQVTIRGDTSLIPVVQ